MNTNVVYGFLGGLYLGRYTGHISNLAMTGLVLYFVKPDFYTWENFNTMKETGLTIIRTILN